MQVLNIMQFDNKKEKIEIFYYFQDKHFEVSKYDYQAKIIDIHFKYNVKNKEIKCYVEKCENYNSYLEIIEREIKLISK